MNYLKLVVLAPLMLVMGALVAVTAVVSWTIQKVIAA